MSIVLNIILFSSFFQLSCLHKNKSNTKSLETVIGPYIKKTDVEQRYMKDGEDTNRRFRKKKRVVQSEVYYEPYLQKGEWVFLRTTSERTTKKRKEKYVGNVESTTKASLGPKPNTPIIELAQIYRDCNTDCPSIYEDNYEDVCGQRFNTFNGNWANEYKHFNSLCELEKENCKAADKMWFLLHRGVCPAPELKMFPLQSKDIIASKNKLIQVIENPFGPRIAINVTK